jgi:hypothetical protein
MAGWAIAQQHWGRAAAAAGAWIRLWF